MYDMLCHCGKQVHTKKSGLCKNHYNQKYREDNPKWNSYSREYQKDRYYKYKNELIIILGGLKCVDCSNRDARVLEIHHKFKDGNKDRKRIGAGIGSWVYYTKHKEEAKKMLVVLCANCHLIRDSVK